MICILKSVGGVSALEMVYMRLGFALIVRWKR